MAQVPANPKLWNMLVAQAKTKFSVYPSPGASHWVHLHYTQEGGKFVESQKAADKAAGPKAAAERKREAKKKRKAKE